ncbi:quinon protein alcohol dehydrogenase-like superfamily [Thamnidium elegans]|nr:quinon protein alcohol dehydrogenase-like superfamily [Thamnidium elegans]
MDISGRFPKYQAYPPVPNWYSSGVTAIVDPHLFLYATRNLVVVLGLQDLEYFNSFAVSNDKIQAIAAHDSFCFTGGVDKVIRGWNILLGSLITSHSEHNAEVTTLKLIRQGTILISGDKSGKVVVVEPFGKLKYIGTKVKSEITSIATTTHNGLDYVAIGYANGMIFVEQVEDDLSLTTQFQIANDNDMIQSLDWQKQIESSDWPLLASSTKRKRNVFIWTFPSQSILTTIRLPNPPAQATEQQKSTVFIELAWSPLYKNKLYLSSYIGSIVCFDLSNKSPKICNNERLERHSRNVFTINWFNEGRNCITTSLDKQVIKWDVTKKICLQNLKTQTGFPYSLQISNCNQGQLAIGMGDNSIKLWNFSNAGSVMKANKYHDYYDANVLWKGLQGKIEKINWHPRKEGFLAFGNEYGHVGIYDTLNLRHMPFKSYHKSLGAPSIDWGLNMCSVLEDSDMMDTLVSCGADGVVHVYDVDHPLAPPINLNERLRENNVSWITSLDAKDSYRRVLKIDANARFIAFGHTDGIVEVYKLDTLKLIFVSNCQRQLIKTLDWKYCDGRIFLAAGCYNGDIAVHDIGAIDMSNIPDTPVPQPEPFCLLKGHSKTVTDIKWSSHVSSAILASASEDNFVIVWDVLEAKHISLFDRHRSRVLSVCWNPTETDVLFSGSEDRFIYEWNRNDFSYTDSIESHMILYDKEKIAWNRNNNKRKADNVDEPIISSTPSTFSLKKKQKKVNTTTSSSAMSNSMHVSQESEKSTSRLKREQYCLILADKMLEGAVSKAVTHVKNTYLNEEQKLDNTLSRYTNFFEDQLPQSLQHENIHDLFFGDKNDIRRLIEIEEKALDEKKVSSPSESSYKVQNNIRNDLDVKLALDIMQCQYKMFSKDQFDGNTNSCMSDWIMLALSPMVGKATWITLMLEQAKKLESLGQYNLSASCYIACTHIYDAVEVYRSHSMFREAIALAKLRLPPKDPIVNKLFAEWANELQKGDSDSLTASCYLMSNMEGSKSNAINALARSGKEAGLFYAACLATAIDDDTKDQRIEQWIKKLQERLNRKLNV